MMVCMRCYVSGRVQGVWFRAATREQAVALGITGYARNLADGRVEVLACGEEKAVTNLREWLWQGPTHAQVTEVVEQSVPVRELTGFNVA
ncbi:MAG: acylphosphatase [Candidatus Competibacteraceae bacterium]